MLSPMIDSFVDINIDFKEAVSHIEFHTRMAKELFERLGYRPTDDEILLVATGMNYGAKYEREAVTGYLAYEVAACQSEGDRARVEYLASICEDIDNGVHIGGERL